MNYIQFLAILLVFSSYWGGGVGGLLGAEGLLCIPIVPSYTTLHIWGGGGGGELGTKVSLHSSTI